MYMSIFAMLFEFVHCMENEIDSFRGKGRRNGCQFEARVKAAAAATTAADDKNNYIDWKI